MWGKDDPNFLNAVNSYTIETDTRVIAEWNMNLPENILEVGNYANNPDNALPTDWSEEQQDNDKVESIVSFDSNYFAEDDTAIAFEQTQEKLKLMYSLEDCVKKLRPRSGINKPLYIGYTASDSYSAQYVNNYGSEIDKRPRYYMPSRKDTFKYWTSFRMDGDTERGISYPTETGNPIDDVAPFVVYKNSVPCNRLVIKMQTNVGEVNQGPYRMGVDEVNDPLYDNRWDKEEGEPINATVPQKWRVEILNENNNWEQAGEVLTSDDIPTDGYVELALGTVLPKDYRLRGEFEFFSGLPVSAQLGDTYWVSDPGYFYSYEVGDGGTRGWVETQPETTWFVNSQGLNVDTPIVTDLLDKEMVKQEFTKIKGIRVVVEEMVRPNITFDLIEMSTRLVADITRRVETFNISRTLGDLGNSTLPIGKLLASTGSLGINNNDGAFSHESQDSIVSDYLHSAIQFKFYDIVRANDIYFVPVKTLYSEGFPQASGNFDSISMNLRDAYGKLEMETAPELFLQDISLSFAITMLLDSVGFSNYKFYRAEGEQGEPVIPFFFVPPNKTVTQVLQDLAVATQSAMWFDEYNNFCVGSKNWVLPDDTTQRDTDGVLLGQKDGASLPNIVTISSDEKRVANDGSINYTERFIQREKATLEQAAYVSEYQSWIYKANLLWEVSGDENLQAYNTAASQGSVYALAAIPLAADIPNSAPEVITTSMGEQKIINNIIDFGEGVSFLGRPSGYFYANGEIIRYDGVEYAISGVGVDFITSAEEFQNYLGELPFNGKIYPTGRVRIWSEPYYSEIGEWEPGPVKEHGRAQFGTAMTEHKYGLDEFWSSNSNVRGMYMDSKIMFTADTSRQYPLDLQTPGGDILKVDQENVNQNSHQSNRSGIINNFLAKTYQVEQSRLKFNSPLRGTVQASALIFEGPSEFIKTENEQGSIISTNPVDTISYIYKDLGNESPYHHFGTRMRVIGEITSNSNLKQKAVGAGEYVSLQAENPSEAVTLIGGSGGLGVMVNPETNQGYFMEIVALSQDVQNRGASNNIYPATVVVQGKSVTITTKGTPPDDEPVEHGIEKDDNFLIMYDDASVGIVGQWKAAGVGKSTISLRIENAQDGTYEAKVQKAEAGTSTMSTVFFYKMMQKDGVLIPYVLWEGIAEILCDDGKFTDIQRYVGQEKTSVYDVAIEYKDNNDVRNFYLYLNGRQIATVVDDNPDVPARNSLALFTRARSKCMFNNVYALNERFAENTAATVVDNINQVFGTDSITNTEALRKYSVSGFVQSSYLKGIGTENAPEYSMYFDEFGTIMRECAYFDVKYDQAFPALAAQIAPVFNNEKGYVVSGFRAGAYGAEFLLFNTTDTFLRLDAETGNFLRISGVTFTQDTTRNLTVDDYYEQVANLSSPKMSGDFLAGDPTKYKEQFNEILKSREKYGTIKFDDVSSIYIQDSALAEKMIGWITNKTKKPRQLLGMQVFGMPHMELGDIYTVDYKVLPTDIDVTMDAVTDPTKRFVTYQIDYQKSVGGVTTTAYLVEV